jgi:hypothetical protein
VGQYGSAWMNWLFGGTIAVFFVVLALFFNESSARYNIDVGKANADGEIEGADGGAKRALLFDSEDSDTQLLGKHAQADLWVPVRAIKAGGSLQ